MISDSSAPTKNLSGFKCKLGGDEWRNKEGFILIDGSIICDDWDIDCQQCLVETLECRLAEAEVFRNYLIALGHLNEDEFYCAYEEDCKKCQHTHFSVISGDDLERDWATCLGYNVKLAAEKAESTLHGEAEG